MVQTTSINSPQNLIICCLCDVMLQTKKEMQNELIQTDGYDVGTYQESNHSENTDNAPPPRYVAIYCTFGIANRCFYFGCPLTRITGAVILTVFDF